uniref:Uncharacterized protein MANES_13G017200 n=1 Tax=Rhizophora mucronata TaxID=61149 RepID=A0A2P2JZB1_RHIMU
MVLGLRSKNRKGTPVQVDYLIYVKEIKPWPPSQSLKSATSILIQWENVGQHSGSLTSNVGDGKVEFSESFKLPVSLCRESSRKAAARDNFQKNYLEFNLFEPRKDAGMKAQLLGSAVINLADYGIIKETMSISTQISFRRSYRITVQPVLYVLIQPFDRDNSSLSKEVLLEKDGSESVSEVTNERNDEESEIDSFTDDDYDDNVSSHSSLTVSSSAIEPIKGSPGQYDKNASTTANDAKRIDKESILPSVVAPPKSEANTVGETFKHVKRVPSPTSSTDLLYSTQNPSKNLAANDVLPDDHFPMDKNSNNVSLEESGINQEADQKTWRHEKIDSERAETSISYVSLTKERKKNEQQADGHDGEFLESDRPSLEEKLVDRRPQNAIPRQVKLRSNTLASNRTAIGVQGSTRRDKLKHLKSVQLQFDSAASDGLTSNNLFLEKVNIVNKPENVNKNGTSTGVIASEHETSAKTAISKGKEIMMGEKPREVSVAEVGLFSVASEHGKSAKTVQLLEKTKETDCPENIHREVVSHAPSEKEQIKSNHPINKADLESMVVTLEEELMEAAALEAGLYSVIAEHGSSTSKVHAPARRLSRFYFHACKAKSQTKSASAARAIMSGLILVSKACGNDVPRLTFWLSNSILLRSIVSQAADKSKLPSAQSIDNDGNRKARHEVSPTEEEKTNGNKRCDEWEDPQTFIMALEKVEAWIFSRIVESVWWQTLTPHMQSTAVKNSSSKKASARRYGLGDEEQGNFAIDLWKKAFKDACERLCPIRAGGHECGCLPVLARLVMEQLVGRLDVAMFNAILRESAEEMPTDPVSDPISDPKVLPIPAGKSSFGAGAQLKNAVGNWSRWLTDLFGIDDDDSSECNHERNCSSVEYETSFKTFSLLKGLSDLMMLPFEMLADKSTRKEVCPTFAAPLIRRILENFVPDEFNPDPIPDAILEALDCEDLVEGEEQCITSFPCNAAPTIYSPPPAALLWNIVGEVGSQTLQRSGSTLLKKSYTSDDELDELDSPMTSIIMDNNRASPASAASSWMQKGKWGRKVVRYQLLLEVWKGGE